MSELQVEMVDNIELQVERAYYDNFGEDERNYFSREFARRRQVSK